MTEGIDLFWLPAAASLVGYFFMFFSKKDSDEGKDKILTLMLRFAAFAIAVGLLTPTNRYNAAVAGFALTATWVFDAMRKIPRNQ